MRVLVAAFFLLLFAFNVEADILRMKTGENKRGKVLSETENVILFNSESDAAVIEIKKSEISIMDQDLSADSDSKKGALTLFTTPAPKKRNPWDAGSSLFGSSPATAAKKTEGSGIFKEEDQNAMIEKLEAFFKSWIDKHPEWTAWLDNIVQKTISKSLLMDKLADAAKKG